MADGECVPLRRLTVHYLIPRSLCGRNVETREAIYRQKGRSATNADSLHRYKVDSHVRNGMSHRIVDERDPPLDVVIA